MGKSGGKKETRKFCVLILIPTSQSHLQMSLKFFSYKGTKTGNHGRCNYTYDSHKSKPNKIRSEFQFTNSPSTNGRKLYQKTGNEFIFLKLKYRI